MTVTSRHEVYVVFNLPKDTWVGSPGYVIGGEPPGFYLRASSNESPEQAIARAREAVDAIRKAVEENGSE